MHAEHCVPKLVLGLSVSSQASLVRHLMHGRHLGSMYFLWPTQVFRC